MRNKFAETFYEVGKLDERICMIVADISPAGSLTKFREQFPERFINTGVAEQVMIGMTAGLTQRGMRPFAYTIATFALYRPFEMVRDDLCYQNLPVTVVGIGGGVTYSTLGATHHAQEDIAIAMSVPNLNVIAPCDPEETALVTRWCATQEVGPVYLRLGRAGEPNLTSDAMDPWRFGKIRRLTAGSDLCMLTYGTITKMVVSAAEKLADKGLSVEIVTVPTLKPLDRAGISELFGRFAHIAVIEECVARALAVEVKALAFDAGYRGRLDTASLRDEFTHIYGSHDQILASHGLTVDAVVELLSRN